MDVVLCSDRDWVLSEEAYLLYAPCMYQPAYDDFKIQMEDFLNAPSVRIFVCENQGEKAGMMVLKYSNAVAEIIGIAVSENLRHQGIGRRMIQFVMESDGAERVEAQTDDDSVGFYCCLKSGILEFATFQGISHFRRRSSYPGNLIRRHTVP